MNKNSQINLSNENPNKVSVSPVELTLNINHKIPLQIVKFDKESTFTRSRFIIINKILTL